MLETVFNFIIQVQIFGEPPPKHLEIKNMQNLINCVQGLGGTAPLKFGKTKKSKIRLYSKKHSNLSANISGTNEDIDKL